MYTPKHIEQIKTLFDLLIQVRKKSHLIKKLQVLASADLQRAKLFHPTTRPPYRSISIIKYDHWKQTQGYKCNSCQKTFNGATGSLQYHL